MKYLIIVRQAALLGLLFFSCSRSAQRADKYYEPWKSLGGLYQDVEMGEIFTDSKTFADCVPKRDPAEIAAAYEKEKTLPEFDLTKFVAENFQIPEVPTATYESKGTFREHLTTHWDYLTRQRGDSLLYSTLIPLPGEYVVPGGRFREIYYWDSYFTMIGLGASGRTDLVKAMLDNFAYLIDTIGFIPNGNRTYYLGRSQPPFFATMVNLYMHLTSLDEGVRYIPAIRKEYDFWMRGADSLTTARRAINHVVRLEDGMILNRYWDFQDFPRPEAYRPDVELAAGLSEEEKPLLYRNLRAAAESGWDFSTRWFQDKEKFGSIRTTDILPVDLNCLMYAMESILTNLYEQSGDAEQANLFYTKASARRQAIQGLFWNQALGAFTDYVWTEDRQSDQLTLAGGYPLYFRVASADQAGQEAEAIRVHLLQPGGLITTSLESGQQWDAPNGWAPLQWICIKGFEHYGMNDLAGEVSKRWLHLNEKVYRNTGKMMEKYNVMDTALAAGGGEYPTQDGFGWTNGVALGLMTDGVVY